MRRQVAARGPRALWHLGLLLALAPAVGGCGEAEDGFETLEPGPRYVADREFRRAALEASIVNPENAYSAERLAEYATGASSGWDALPLWNPTVRPVTVDDLGRSWELAATGETRTPVFERSAFQALGEGAWEHEALMELGAYAFETYPLQLDAMVDRALSSEAEAARFGLWRDERGRVGGLVRVSLPEGRSSTALTCATCHAIPNREGVLEHGRTNAAYDPAGIRIVLGSADPQGALGGWLPGTVDVTADGVTNPVAITDLRAVSRQTHLHWAGTLLNDLIGLAVRVETLIVTSSAAGRPPRELAFALAYYIWNLEAPALEGEVDDQGAALFATHCARCHGEDGVPTGPVPLAEVGTDPRAGESTSRGTGQMRVPTLWGAATRTQLLHRGEVSSLDELLNPARLTRVPGHAFGTDLSEDERAALVRFVGSIGD